MEEHYPTLDGPDGKPCHPVLQALKGGGEIEKVRLVQEMEDDHLPAFDVTVTVNGVEYNYSDWWLSREGVKMYTQAECEKAEEARKSLKLHLLG